MANVKRLPDSGVLRQLRIQGKTQAEIAAEYGVTIQAVYLALRDAGLGQEPRPRALPAHWKVRKDHQFARPAQMLRLLARQQRGVELTQWQQGTLYNWLKELKDRDVVVDYDPEMQPNDASPIHGGFYYRPRSEQDGDSVTRNT